ncbi:MAG: hypothetical protein K8S27_04135 [Candidatus Omnitrophica bacterium]|nr:hypothetical protein [Candidatus Omnitrophota bacterium]
MKFVFMLIIFVSILPASIFAAEEAVEGSSYWDQIKDKIQNKTDENKERTRKAKVWIEEDIKRIGDWEYYIEELSLADLPQLEETLNRLGEERWQCFWVETGKNKSVFLFKRPAISYLHRIPKGDVLRLLNGVQGD